MNKDGSTRPMSSPTDPRAAYKAAGVNVAAGDRLVERIGPAVAATRRPGAEPALGGFGAVFDLAASGHEGALLVASTDGVGTKLRLATELGRHEGIGIDLVAMCVNDILVQGAEPLFFLDYYATGVLDIDAAAVVIEGIAAGCAQAGCALIGGETAEMPGHYGGGDYDLAGFVVGAVQRDAILPRHDLAAGDVLIALPASGAHANGYSLIRKVAAARGWRMDEPFPGGDPGESLADVLLCPTRIYATAVRTLVEALGPAVKAMAHITGGGLTGNVPRMLRPRLSAALTRATFPEAPLMRFLQAEAELDDAAMEATFNCGIGLVIAVASGAAEEALTVLSAVEERPVIVGAVIAADGPSSCTIG